MPKYNQWTGQYYNDDGTPYQKSNKDVWKEFNDGIDKTVKWLFSGNKIAQAIQGSSLYKGLTGQTSAEATLQANERNIANQNYWNQITMQREDTAHQREVADLQAAGLNPWLSMGNGAQSVAMNTAQADPVDGSKILSATSAAALLAIVKLMLKK